MENNLEKFKNTLKNIFQIDRADLDFGIYRILNQKHKEIETFLEQDLLPQVKKELATYEAGDLAELSRELDEKVAKFRADGFTDDQINANEKVAELRDKLKTADRVADLESEVFSHLLRFFERYYEEGDFISKRRYKDGVYAIPYEGEEVKLYWANHDQYYIKTSERFKDFSFKIGDRGIHFKIREAETDTNNNKNISGKDRRFVLCAEDFWQEDGAVLNIYFEYVSVDGKKKQEECSKEATERILAEVPAYWKSILATPTPTEKQKDRTMLEKFLTSYTARNTFDYFIHKDLGTFLTRELDFYIKNEVMFLDDIESETVPRAEQYLAKVKVIRAIGKKIIRMLAQLEDFQKKLWEKKKFVVGTGYCITLDLVPERFYDAILSSEAQRNEWKQLGFIDDTTSLDHEYLRAHPTLSIDTKFFPEWRDELLAEFDNLDERVNGVMINSENFGALNLLQERYKEQVKSIYIDPPYNTDASPILYKNSYKDSSWLSLIVNRLTLSKDLISNNGLIAVAIDDFELNKLQSVIDEVFTFDARLGNTIVVHNPGGRHDDKYIATAHEYCLYYGKNILSTKTNLLPLEESDIKTFNLEENGEKFRTREFRRSGNNSTREARPLMYYPILIKNGKISTVTETEFKQIYDQKRKKFDDLYLNRLITQYQDDGYETVLPIDSSNVHRVWRWGIETLNNRLSDVFFEKKSNEYVIKVKDWLKNKAGLKPKSLWNKPRYAGATGTAILKDILGSSGSFSYPKSVYTVSDSLRISLDKSDSVLDYFAGSGTTGHAVLKLNREDNERNVGSGQRKYILVEMGAYFDTVTKPRMQKVVYSDEWSGGKPQDDGATGTREHIIKYFKLESYEDTLNNLELVRTDDQQATLDQHPHFREDYTLGYMLDVEARGSVLRLNAFRNPFAYTIKLATDVVGESRDTPVDLVETFNYLIGLKTASIRRHGENLLVVEGETRSGEKTLVIWRNQEVVTNDGLDDFFKKQNYSTTDFEFDRVYVNGDNNLENLKADSDQWKVVTIEEEFHKRMFA